MRLIGFGSQSGMLMSRVRLSPSGSGTSAVQRRAIAIKLLKISGALLGTACATYTLNPSIRANCWHGFIKDGEILSALMLPRYPVYIPSKGRFENCLPHSAHCWVCAIRSPSNLS